MKKIVIVEDDAFMREELTDIFQKAGYPVHCITRFSQTVADILAEDAGLILLDLNLPGMNGFDICRQVKQQSSIPILVLTSQDQLRDELHALQLGADEYLTKPCHASRLLARVENLLKRFAGRENLLDGNGFLLDHQTYALYADDQSLVLSENEGRILEELMLHRGEVVTKKTLFQALWGTTEYVDENALQVNMTRLRHTLKKVGLDQRVETIRGVGYCLRI
ncbi:MAG: response regulator transcription factor [Lachnospiraceae bacterium]|nr:response regulator transcription factor [Lachnospiraceae bacterium]